MVANVDIQPIKTEEDYDRALAAVERLMDAEPDTPEGDALNALVTLIEAYEAEHWSIDPADSLEARRTRMTRHANRLPR